MSGSLVIARREIESLARLPVGWVSAALFTLLTGIVVGTGVLVPGEPATLRPFFSATVWLLLPIAPALSMRLFSEEYRAGTIETLMTAPVSDASLVLGKYAGGLAFFAMLLLPTLAYPAVLWAVSSPAPDIGPVLAGYLCVMLLGALYLSVGMLASALTSNQTLAFLATLVALVLLLSASSASTEWLPEPVVRVLLAASIPSKVADFARGMIDLRHVFFFLGLTAWFVGATVPVVADRRRR